MSTSAALLALVAVGMLVDATQPLPFDVCLWKRLVGIDCLTCGLTRAVCSALQLEVAASWRYHPAGVFVAAGLVAAALREPAATAGRSIKAAIAPLIPSMRS